jgi:hypothetical protein
VLLCFVKRGRRKRGINRDILIFQISGHKQGNEQGGGHSPRYALRVFLHRLPLHLAQGRLCPSWFQTRFCRSPHGPRSCLSYRPEQKEWFSHRATKVGNYSRRALLGDLCALV